MAWKNPPEFGVGKTYCVECEGRGHHIRQDALSRCEDCDGKGWVVCEHWEREDGICLDCSYDFRPDMIDEAERRIQDR